MEVRSLHSVYQDRASFAESEFNKNRKFIIKNVPPVTYEEVKQFIGGFTVSNISISKKCRHAIVTLVHGQEAEEAVRVLSGLQLLGTNVEVCLCLNENMLCVAHLPVSLSDEDFKKEVEPFGPVEKCFLLRDSQTGCSKGYGFVEYAHNRMKLQKACEMLNKHKIGLTFVKCSFLDPSVLRFQDLYSKCLLVEDLPQDYTNQQELTNVCSVITEPQFFQLEAPHRLALVQYREVDDADATLQEIDGHVIGGYTIKVSFCRPGVKFEVLCRDAVSSRLREEEWSRVPPLMPPDGHVSHPSLDPNKLASPVVKKLLAENPEALEKFIELLGMLQNQFMKGEWNYKPNMQGPPPGTSSVPLMNPNLQIALLSVMMAQQIQRCQPSFIQDTSTQEFILNSLQQQHQPQKPPGDKPQSSLMGSPLVAQANSLLMNAINNSDTQTLDNSNANNSAVQSQFALFPDSEQETLSTSCLQDFNHLMTALTPKSSTAPSRLAKTNLSETKRGGETGETLSQNSTKQGFYGLKAETYTNLRLANGSVDCNHKVENPFFHLPGVGYANPFLASFIEQQIKSEVRQINQSAQKPVSLLELPVLNNRKSQRPPSIIPHSDPFVTNVRNDSLPGNPAVQRERPMMQNPSILGNYPSTPTSWNKPVSLMGNFVAEKRTLSFEGDSKVPMKRKTTSETRNFGLQAPYSNNVKMRPGGSVNKSGQVTSLMDMDLSAAPLQNTGPNTAGQWGGRLVGQRTSLRNNVDHTGQINQSRSTANQPNHQQYLAQSRVQNVLSGPHLHSGINSQGNNFQVKNPIGSRGTNMMLKKRPLLITNNTNAISNQPDTMNHREGVQPLIPSLSAISSDRRPPLISQVNTATKEALNFRSTKISPLLSQNLSKVSSGLLIKPHLVPSPEVSPNGAYIGQHSQGLGGHYADSYLQR